MSDANHALLEFVSSSRRARLTSSQLHSAQRANEMARYLPKQPTTASRYIEYPLTPDAGTWAMMSISCHVDSLSPGNESIFLPLSPTSILHTPPIPFWHTVLTLFPGIRAIIKPSCIINVQKTVCGVVLAHNHLPELSLPLPSRASPFSPEDRQRPRCDSDPMTVTHKPGTEMARSLFRDCP